MLDKDAKLFGKINIIDFFIILAIIGAVAFVAVRFGGGGDVPFIGGPATQEFYISFFTEEVENFTVEAINIGDNVWDNGFNIAMGVVTGLDIADAIIWNPDRYGNTIRSNKDGFSSLEIHARLNAVPSDNGIMVGGNRYGIGHSLAVRAGASIIFMRISGLQAVGA